MTEILRPRRTYALTATVLFFTAYAAIMVLVLAPKDMFAVTPASMTQPAE